MDKQEGGIRAGEDITAGRDMAGRDIVQRDMDVGLEFSMDDWFSRSQQMIDAAGLSDVERQYATAEVTALQRETAKEPKAWDWTRIYGMLREIAVYLPALAQALESLFRRVSR